MDVKRYLETLELQPGASMDELNQAYKDMVNIWHPDRFAHNPRLKSKAEEKLKEVNQAYEALRPLLSSEKRAEAGSHGQGRSKTGPDAREAGNHYGTASETEALIEAGTANVLRLWSYLSARLRRAVADQVQAFKQGARIDPGEPGAGQGRGGGRGKGRGRRQGRRRSRGGGRRSSGSRGGMGGRGA
jgi:DnaJ-class molecular chaperone